MAHGVIAFTPVPSDQVTMSFREMFDKPKV